METNIELILFLIIGGIAIASAAMMLMSENAVHSALFLIINFACVAFLYLMLNAAFLAMVQITVYAGAIMVLFMFVIMLLGAERLQDESIPRFPWLPRAAVGLTAVFLVLAGYFIIESEISSTEPEPLHPAVQVINSVPDFESVDIYLNDELVAEEVEYHQASEFVEVPAGDYTVTFKGHLEDAEAVEGLPIEVIGGEGALLTLEENQTISLVFVPTEEGVFDLLPVEKDLDTVEHKFQTNIQVVHAAPGYGAVDFADITQHDETPREMVENLSFGETAETLVLREGTHQFGVYEAGVIAEVVANAQSGEKITLTDVEALHRLEEKEYAGNTTTLYIITPPRVRTVEGQAPDVLPFVNENRPAFGGPTSVGMELYTTYLLPFQVIALLLLVAMIGAIVLTRDAITPPKKRFERRLANTAATPIVGESSQD